MKRIYVRFFNSQADEISADSYFVRVEKCDTEEMLNTIQEVGYKIGLWMAAHPKGKVDFVWE